MTTRKIGTMEKLMNSVLDALIEDNQECYGYSDTYLIGCTSRIVSLFPYENHHQFLNLFCNLGLGEMNEAYRNIWNILNDDELKEVPKA